MERWKSWNLNSYSQFHVCFLTTNYTVFFMYWTWFFTFYIIYFHTEAMFLHLLFFSMTNCSTLFPWFWPWTSLECCSPDSLPLHKFKSQVRGILFPWVPCSWQLLSLLTRRGVSDIIWVISRIFGFLWSGLMPLLSDKSSY